MADLPEIEERLAAYVRGELVAATTVLELDTDLVGLVDSAAMVELIIWIETEYGFDVELDDMTPTVFGTIRKIAGYIASRAQA
jgi:acyl carrier protein